MEIHYFSWGNPLEMVIFYSYVKLPTMPRSIAEVDVISAVGGGTNHLPRVARRLPTSALAIVESWNRGAGCCIRK
jgi:hypothetical protein